MKLRKVSSGRCLNPPLTLRSSLAFIIFTARVHSTRADVFTLSVAGEGEGVRGYPSLWSLALPHPPHLHALLPGKGVPFHPPSQKYPPSPAISFPPLSSQDRGALPAPPPPPRSWRQIPCTHALGFDPFDSYETYLLNRVLFVSTRWPAFWFSVKCTVAVSQLRISAFIHVHFLSK